MNLLTVVIALPLVAFLVALILPKESPQFIRIFAITASVVIFAISLGLIAPFWFHSPHGFQFETDLNWISSPRIHYHVAIDGVSLWLILLTTLLTPICVLLSWRYIDKRPKEFYAF